MVGGRNRALEACAFLAKIAVLFWILALVAFGVFGCTTGPDGGVYIDKTVWVFVTNSVGSADGGSVKGGGASSGSAEPASSATEAAPAPAVALDFRYGGFHGEKAKEKPGCRIGSLRVTMDGLSFKWEHGGCETLGAAGHEDYSKTVACAFYWDGSKWVGGKFDWISTSRTSRTFENVRSGYGGWDAVAFFRATKHAFCIVSVDGKKRSNLIED